MDTVVEVRELRKVFNGTVAVDSISFDMKRGEILGLLGPNGAGKTTTMHMILGLTTPTSGTIRVLGEDTSRRNAEILKRVNFSSSYVSLPYSLTIDENLKVFARLYDIKDRDKKIEEVLDIFDIKDIRKETTRKLSSGQITRVSLAKSFLNDPEILFLDEPTASLDPDIADRTRKLLMKLSKEKAISILYTSHNMVEMEEVCDRIVFLDCGRIITTGRPVEIKERFGGASLEEAFLKIARRGSPCRK